MSTKACPVVPGRAYSFEYPRHNFHGVLSYMEHRRIEVEQIRDLVEDPIDAVTFEFQPLLKRSRYLVIGQDLDKHERRRFYLDSMKVLCELLSSSGQIDLLDSAGNR